MSRTPGAARGTHEMSVDETAALWRVRLSSAPTAEERAGLERWLAAAPEHKAAYEAMNRAWNAAGEEAGDPDIRAMREAALRFQPPARRAPLNRRLTIAAAVAAVAVAGAWFVLEHPSLQDLRAASMRNVTHGQFQTAIGERATIRLGDGSTVTLNTDSRVQLDLGQSSREVRLLDGQAIFEVAQDKTRPFVVIAGDRKITALGTAFDVRLERREVRVTLVEGKVAIDQLSDPAVSESASTIESPSAAPVTRTRLEVGEQFVAPVGGTATVQGANVERITSWREGRLIFEGDRLADALAEMNRYSPTPITLGDPAIGELRVSGVFRTGQPAAFAHALEQYFPLESTRNARSTVLRWRQ